MPGPRPHRHHHHHGGGIPWRGGGGPWYGPGPWYNYPSPDVFVVADPCTGFDPVLATDGRTYDNPCLARRAGASVVRRVQRPVSGMGGVMDMLPQSTLGKVALAVGGYLAYRAFTKKKYR